jgi:integrase
MPRKLTGNAFEKRGKFYARITLGPKLRPAIPLPTCATQEEADTRAELLSSLAGKLRKAGQIEQAPDILERAGEAATGKPLDAVIRLVDQIEQGEWTRKTSSGTTLRQLGERWTSGELARLYPDHIRQKGTATNDKGRLELYVYPQVANVAIEEFTLDDAERVMRSIPAERSPATRRHVAQLLHRLLGMAVFPLRLIPANPLPKGFLPKLGAGKAKGSIHPSEDVRLLASPAVPLPWRLYWGFLHREGLRFGEAARLTWQDLELARGALTLDVNKTSDPRAWALSAGVAPALRTWKALREKQGGDTGPAAPVFIDEVGEPINPEGNNAIRYRTHLEAAGIDRPELFKSSKARRMIRAHDARGAFVSTALANGRSEQWVMDRTGHRSSTMLAVYRRAARTSAELGLGDWTPLDQAIPELGPPGGKGTGNGTTGGEGEPPNHHQTPISMRCPETESNRPHEDFQSDARHRKPAVSGHFRHPLPHGCRRSPKSDPSSPGPRRPPRSRPARPRGPTFSKTTRPRPPSRLPHPPSPPHPPPAQQEAPGPPSASSGLTRGGSRRASPDAAP